MALNSTTKQAIEAFVDGLETANPVSLNVDNLEFNRTISKKFAKMIGGVKKKDATIANKKYTLTKEGAVSLIEMFDEGESLAPSYNASGTLDINSDVNKDTVVFGGNFESKITTLVDGNEVTSPSTMTVDGNNVFIYDTKIRDYSCVILQSPNSIVAEGCTIDNRNGNLSNGKSVQSGQAGGNKKNSALQTSSNPKSIVIRDLKVYASDSDGNNKLYNGIELTGGSNTKEIIIENCQFLGFFNHNILNLYQYGDNCVLTVRKCYFDTTENVIRLSNYGNNTGLVINFEDCIFEKWDGAPNKVGGIYPENGAFASVSDPNDYAGFMLCQDPTTPAANAATVNCFGNDANGKPKVTVNIKNCTGPNGPIQPKFDQSGNEDQSGYSMTSLADQLCYVYGDKFGCVKPFDASRYPVIHVSYEAAPQVRKDPEGIPAL